MVFRTFTQTYDLNTEVGKPTLLGIHTPIGGDAVRFLYPFYQAYKKMKYLGCDITIVNAARLPFDPEQIGKIDGVNYVDPRDSLNPIMFRGCHGESLGQILNSMYGGLTTDIFKGSALDRENLNQIFEDFYYTALGDDGWRKSGLQKTLRIKGLHPLVYGLATNHQIMPSNQNVADYIQNTDGYDANAVANDTEPGTLGATFGNGRRAFAIEPTTLFDPTLSEGNDKYRFLSTMFTNRLTRLGWLDTMQMVGSTDNSSAFSFGQATLLPKIFMGILMLPPCYLTRSYLRIIITHKWKFSGYRSITTGAGNPGVVWSDTSWGYSNEMTGNVPNAGESKVALSECSPLGDTEGGIDYDAVEEIEDDEFDSH